MAPGASHSGWEDHFQSDPFHYMHHRYFEVNYAGTPAGFMDHLFSTFCDKFREGDKEGAKAREDAKASLTSPPTWEFLGYLALAGGGCLGPWVYHAQGLATGGALPSQNLALALALLAGVGPVLSAVVVSSVVRSGSGGSGKQSLLSTVVQLFFGNVVCTVPIALGAYMTLAPGKV